MLTDIDLDVSNYVDKQMGDGETILFIHTHKETISYNVNGDMVTLVDMLLKTEDLYDVILNVAGNIVVDKDIDFDAVVEFIKKAKK